MEKEYYVYLILDIRKPQKTSYDIFSLEYQPFYVGKGKGSRIKEHFRPSSLKRNNIKNNIIKKIVSDTSMFPITCKVFENLTEEEAFKKEAELINFFGRIDKATGVLANHTDGGEGHSGYNQPKPYKRKQIYQYDLFGNLIKRWDSISEAANECKLLAGNISTAIKRNGTCGNFMWSYTEIKLKPKIKFQTPIKYKNIQQIDIKTGEVLYTYADALEIEVKLNLRSGARNKIYDCLNNKLKTAYGYKWKEQK